MGDGANVFNTFSFNKWADGKREEEIDKESRKRRAEQIKRLKERLRTERALRESQGDGDLDLDALIEAIQRGELINNPVEEESPSPSPVHDTKPKNQGIPDNLSDDYIFNEVNLYASRINDMKYKAMESIPEPPTLINLPKPDPLSWKFNRRNGNNEPAAKPQEAAPQRNNSFKFNRTNNHPK